MTIAFAIFLVLHAALHLLGAIKAARPAALPQLTQPIAPFAGAVWLAAALLFVAAAVCLFVAPRIWWAIGACAVVASTLAILPSWADAKFGMAANAIVLAGVVFGFLAGGPWSLRAEYERDLARVLDGQHAPSPVTESDLAGLPEPVQRYLRAAGAVGRPRIHNFRVTMHGRIRGGPEDKWMPFRAEQHNVIGEAARLFYMNAFMIGIPVQGYHRYLAGSATMRVKAAALVTVANASGAEMTQSETVTLFNDMCVMAPATLVDPAISWQSVDSRTARASFTNAGRTVRAELFFGDAGELTDFRSDDRYQIGPHGNRRVRWSTPVGRYRSFGGARLASSGEGRWHEGREQYPYIELTIGSVEYNVPAPGVERRYRDSRIEPPMAGRSSRRPRA